MSEVPVLTPQAVLVGGSAGALEALPELVARLPPALAVPVVIVLHLARGRASLLPEVVAGWTSHPVREPEDHDPLAPATIYVAPAGYHLLVDRGPVFTLSADAPVNHSIPSIDVLFQSAAELFGPRALGLLLSGASADGAAGVRAIHDAGGRVMIQDRAEARCPTMPAAGLARCPGARVGRIAALAGAVASLCRGEP